MDYDRIQATHRKERQKDSLQHLDSTFYQDAAVFLEDLHAQRQRVADASDDPFSSPEVQKLTDQIETIEETLESLYERRMGKIVKAASFKAAGMSVDVDATTTEEHALFNSLVTDLEENREHVLSTIENGAEPTTTDTAPGTEQDSQHTPTTPSHGDKTTTHETNGTSESPDRSEQNGETKDIAQALIDDSSTDQSHGESEHDDTTVSRLTVRMTDDVGEIFGVDEREYELIEDDVVTLPEENASVLVEQDVATVLD